MSVYQEIIMDHYHSPRNACVLEDARVDVSLANTSCGDTVRLTIKAEDETIAEIGIQVKGCVIATASASLLSEYVKGATLSSVLQLKSSDIVNLLHIDLSPNRLKCALLPLEALSKAVQELQT